MQRISGYSAAPGNLFRNEDVQAGLPGTIIDAAWLNAVQEEIAQLIERGGGVLDANNPHQMADLLLGKDAELPGTADLKIPAGASLTGVPRATCSTPKGVAISGSDGKLWLCRGGTLTLVYQPSQTEAHSWATMIFNDNRLTRSYLVDGTIYTDRWTLSPTTALHPIPGRGWTFSEVGARAQVGIALPVGPTGVGNDTATINFVAGWLVSPQHLVFVRRRRVSEAGLDQLQIVIRWVDADVDVDVVAYTEALSSTGDYSFPTSSFLMNRVVGGRVPLAGAANASLIRCLVCLPTSASGAAVARMVALTVNDGNLSADNVISSSVNTNSSQGARPSTIPVAWTPGLEMLISTGVAWIMERLGGGLYRCAVTSTGVTVTPQNLVTPTRQLGLATAQGRLLSVSEFSGQLSISAPTQDGRTQLLLRMPVDELAARIDGFEWVRHGVWNSDRRMMPLGVIATLPRGLAVYPWGLCVSSPAPVYGTWSTRSATPILGIAGVDDSGRVVAVTGDDTTQVGLVASPPMA